MEENQEFDIILKNLLSEKQREDLIESLNIREESKKEFIKNAIIFRINQTPNTFCKICREKLIIDRSGLPIDTEQCDHCSEWCCCGYMKFRSYTDPNHGVKYSEEVVTFCNECLREWALESDYIYEEIMKGSDIFGRDLEDLVAPHLGYSTCIKEVSSKIDWKWKPSEWNYDQAEEAEKGIEEEFKVIKMLEELSNSRIESIGDCDEEYIVGYKLENGHITCLSLDGDSLKRKLTNLPDIISKLENLQQLNLNSNLLTSLPQSFFNLTNLEKLDLNSNRLTMIPESIKNLTELKDLQIYDNQIKSLPEGLCDLKNLESLVIGKNPIRNLPKKIGNLPKLKELYIEDIPIMKLPNSISNLINLEVLALSAENWVPIAETTEKWLERLKQKGSDLSSVEIPDKEEFIIEKKILNGKENT